MPGKLDSRTNIITENPEHWQRQTVFRVDSSEYTCQQCGWHTSAAVPFACPMCGHVGLNTAETWQRARSLIRHANASKVDGEWPVQPNVLMRRFYQNCLQAKQLKLSGHTERAIAAMQGVSKTAVHNRLRHPFAYIRKELRRIARYLPVQPVNDAPEIGIDQRPAKHQRPHVQPLDLVGHIANLHPWRTRDWLHRLWLDHQPEPEPEPAGFMPF